MDFNKLKPTSVLTTPSQTIEKDKRDEWVIFNIAQSGKNKI